MAVEIDSPPHFYGDWDSTIELGFILKTTQKVDGVENPSWAWLQRKIMKYNIAPEKGPFQEETSLPTTIFQGLRFQFRGRSISYAHQNGLLVRPINRPLLYMGWWTPTITKTFKLDFWKPIAIGGLSPPGKTNMTMENPPFEDVFLLNMGIFQCHASFEGCTRFAHFKWQFFVPERPES